jgi:hypothetical protein
MMGWSKHSNETRKWQSISATIAVINQLWNTVPKDNYKSSKLLELLSVTLNLAERYHSDRVFCLHSKSRFLTGC